MCCFRRLERFGVSRTASHKRLISVYSDGALTPYGVTVSPRLGIGISRLEFNVKNEIERWDLEGFSCATEIAWSLIDEKPLLK